jgi:hypothetical protein
MATNPKLQAIVEKHTATAQVTVPATAEKVEIHTSEVLIAVPISPEISKKYMSQHIDTDLTHSEAITCRRIQDALELSGAKCAGPASVVKHLLGLIASEMPELRNSGTPEV